MLQTKLRDVMMSKQTQAPIFAALLLLKNSYSSWYLLLLQQQRGCR